MFTTSAICTCDTAPADALAAAPPSARRPARLHDHAVGPGRVHRPQNRTDVVRVFDAVEHDEQRRSVRAANQIAPTSYPGTSSTTAMTPWCTPPRESRSSAHRRHAPDAYTAFTRKVDQLPEAAAAPFAHAQLADPSGAQRFEHRVHPVNNHRDNGFTPPGAPARDETHEARSEAPMIRRTPAASSRAALHGGHREIQLRSFGFSGQREPDRMQQAIVPFWPVRSRTRPTAALNVSRSSHRRIACELVGERADDARGTGGLVPDGSSPTHASPSSRRETADAPAAARGGPRTAALGMTTARNRSRPDRARKSSLPAADTAPPARQPAATPASDSDDSPMPACRSSKTLALRPTSSRRNRRASSSIGSSS